MRRDYKLDDVTKVINLRRFKIAALGKEAEQNYKAGKVKTGTVDDLWKVLN